MLLVPRLSHGASSSLQKMRRDTLEARYFVTHKLGCRFSGDVFAGAGLPSLFPFMSQRPFAHWEEGGDCLCAYH